MNPLKKADLRRLLTQRRWILPLLGAAAVSIAVYVVAVVYLFPYPEFKRWIETQLRSAGYEAQLEKLGPGAFLGMKAQRLLLAPSGAPDRRAELRNVKAKLSLLGLVTFRPRISLAAEAVGGNVDARWRLGRQRELSLRWNGMDLALLPLPPDMASAGLRGRATGTLDALLPAPQGPASNLSGSFQTTIADARLGPGNLGGIPLPGVTLGTGQFRFSAQRGRIQVQTAQFEGGNLGASFRGTVDIPADGGPAAVDGILALRPQGRAVDDLAFLLTFFPGAKSSDGTYTAHVGGHLGALIFSPATTSR